ncbi:MAG: serine hydrolase [Bacteroidales bacterium]|nr:serine hydrolase [Bacteroidales bacterium]
MTGKKVFYGIALLFGLALVGGAIYVNSLMPIITGYAAKNLCSNVFISGRDAKEIEDIDLNFSFIKFTSNKLDQEEQSVTSRFLWGRSKAIYREGFGATLVRDASEEELRSEIYPSDTDPDYLPGTTAWPLGDIVPDTVDTGIDRAAVTEIARKLVYDTAYGGIPFAFVVLHKGIPVAEKYRQGLGKDTRFLSWSMAKSFTNAIVGVLTGMGKMDVSEPAEIEEWKNDERSRISLNDLLQMQSGLEWNEDYGSRSDVNLMLFDNGDMSRFAATRPMEHAAGTQWKYSSGTANILTSLISNEFDSDTACYAFIHDNLLEKIGITDAVFEVDPSGDLVGSSYLYATARDYARFGLLYINDGIFCGERVLPEGWVDYTRTPASASEGQYGALFWLNRSREYPSAPEDMYSCQGHDGQMIFILPSSELVIVVLGFSHRPDNALDFDGLLRDVLKTI